MFSTFSDPNSPIPLTFVTSNMTRLWNDTLMGNVTQIKWPEYSDERPYLDFSTNMTLNSVKTHFGEPATSFWTTLIPVLLKSNYQILETRRIRDFTYLSAFKIQQETAELVLTALTIAISALFIICLVLIICLCRTVS